jgi:GTP cyclohydrolase II
MIQVTTHNQAEIILYSNYIQHVYTADINKQWPRRITILASYQKRTKEVPVRVVHDRNLKGNLFNSSRDCDEDMSLASQTDHTASSAAVLIETWHLAC